jgi:cell division protein FtsQ
MTGTQYFGSPGVGLDGGPSEGRPAQGDGTGEDASVGPGPTVVGGAGPEGAVSTGAGPEGAVSTGAGDRQTVVHPRLWQRRMAVLRDQGRRRLRWIVGGVAVLLAACVAVLALHTPLLALRHTTVLGATHTGTEAVLQAAGLVDDPPLIDVDPRATALRVERLPWVAHAVVVREWPDSVKITVTERVALGSVARPGGGVALVDATGRVLAWEDGAAPGLVLAGPVTPGRPGTVLPSAARPALAVASALTPTLAARVVEVAVDTHGMVTLDLGARLSARLGSTQDLQAKLVAVASVLAGAHVSSPAMIDVTIPDEPTVGPPPAVARTGSRGR